jgi:predicted PurR-regulated permease PerM
MKKGKDILIYAALSVGLLYFFFYGLVLAKAFLAPLVTAVVLAFLMLPLSIRMERWGISRLMATSISTLLLLITALAFSAVIFFQVRGFTDDWGKIEVRLDQLFYDVSKYLSEHTPLEQSYILSISGKEETSNTEVSADGSQEETTSNDPEKTQDQVVKVLSAAASFITNIIIVFVYVFFIIHFRARLRDFILRFFTRDKRPEVTRIISRSVTVSRRYLTGKLLLMVFLAILYFVGLLLSGLQNALLVSLIAAALSIIPVVGNLFGYFIALALGLLTGDQYTIVFGVTLTFVIAQFIDTYIFQPIILGNSVGVHPFFIILSVVLGYEVWGIIGMVISIPVFGVVTIVCRNVPYLYPFGYVFSNSDLEEPEDIMAQKS